MFLAFYWATLVNVTPALHGCGTLRLALSQYSGRDGTVGQNVSRGHPGGHPGGPLRAGSVCQLP